LAAGVAFMNTVVLYAALICVAVVKSTALILVPLSNILFCNPFGAVLVLKTQPFRNVRFTQPVPNVIVLLSPISMERQIAPVVIAFPFPTKILEFEAPKTIGSLPLPIVHPVQSSPIVTAVLPLPMEMSVFVAPSVIVPFFSPMDIPVQASPRVTCVLLSPIEFP